MIICIKSPEEHNQASCKTVTNRNFATSCIIIHRILKNKNQNGKRKNPQEKLWKYHQQNFHLFRLLSAELVLLPEE